MFGNRLTLAAAMFSGAIGFGFVDPAEAAPPARPVARLPVVVNRPMPQQPLIVNRPAANRMPGWDWWRTYPYSSYNAWRNPYWYYPYTPYVTPPYYYGVPASNYYYNNYYNDLTLPPLPSLPPLN